MKAGIRTTNVHAPTLCPPARNLSARRSPALVARTFFALAFCTLTFHGSAGAQSPVTNQHLFDTTAFIPEHGERRMAEFAQQPVATGRIMFLGDSITEGGDWGTLLGDTTVVNRGISGDITFGVLERLDDVTRRRPSKLFILIGVNDIGKDIPDNVIADNVRKIIQITRRQSPETEIYLQSLLPVNPTVKGFPQHYDKQQHVLNTNRLLRIVASATEVTYVDLFPAFLDDDFRLDPGSRTTAST